MRSAAEWQIETIAPNELDASLVVAWERLRELHAEYVSPFFSSSYTRMMAEVRDGVECAVILRDGQVAGFFPFQRSGRSSRSAIPVGGPLTDFQGPIITPDADLVPEKLLDSCRLDHWSFRYLAKGWNALERCRFRRMRSPVIGLADGFGTFTKSLESRQSDLMHKHVRGIRTLNKRVGPTRFELDCELPDALDRLLSWKAAQHVRTDTRDEFRPPWARRLLGRMLETRDPLFSGHVSGLFAGDVMVAGALNLISGTTLHVWITAYDPAYSKYSPGAHCMIELIRAAAGRGIRRIDLGHGEEPYKYRLCTEIEEVAEGYVDRRWWAAWQNRGIYEVRRRVLESRLNPWLQRWKKQVRGWQQRWSASQQGNVEMVGDTSSVANTEPVADKSP